ncbi:hypothetical protein CBR_g88550 [Chara braunii]|uniref:Uncharacterized protein n=1 Tax=Chara braunii TaxID=69332 RepID=A0A388KB62_CHABU|nr:hypothetical protein CBR_g88550 [Chara braunii]|eukprot:GBG67261.1 hypothetical protein CBR_g88550 [Chara braunii]
MRVVFKNAEHPPQGGSFPDKQGGVEIPWGQVHPLLLQGEENLATGVPSREDRKDAEERVNEACIAVNAVANGSEMALVIAAENGEMAPVDAAAANEGPAEHRMGKLAGTDADGTNGDSKGMRNSPCNGAPKPTAKKAQGKQAMVKKAAESKPSEDNAMSAPAGRKTGTKRAAEEKPSGDKLAKKQKRKKSPPIEKAAKEDKPLDGKPVKRQRKGKKPPDEEVAKEEKPSDIKSGKKQQKGERPLEEEAKQNAVETVLAPGMVTIMPLPTPPAAEDKVGKQELVDTSAAVVNLCSGKASELETIVTAIPSAVEQTQAKLSASVGMRRMTKSPSPHEAADAATQERASGEAEEAQNHGEEEKAASVPTGRKRGAKRVAEERPSTDKPRKKQNKEKRPLEEEAAKEEKASDDKKPVKKQQKGKKPLEEEAAKENAAEAVPAPGMVVTVPLPTPRAAEMIPAATPSTFEPTQAKVSASVEPTKSTAPLEAADAATQERTSSEAEDVQNCGVKNGNSEEEFAGSQEQAIKAKDNSTTRKTRPPPSDEWACIHGYPELLAVAYPEPVLEVVPIPDLVLFPVTDPERALELPVPDLEQLQIQKWFWNWLLFQICSEFWNFLFQIWSSCRSRNAPVPVAALLLLLPCIMASSSYANGGAEKEKGAEKAKANSSAPPMQPPFEPQPEEKQRELQNESVVYRWVERGKPAELNGYGQYWVRCRLCNKQFTALKTRAMDHFLKKGKPCLYRTGEILHELTLQGANIVGEASTNMLFQYRTLKGIVEDTGLEPAGGDKDDIAELEEHLHLLLPSQRQSEKERDRVDEEDRSAARALADKDRVRVQQRIEDDATRRMAVRPPTRVNMHGAASAPPSACTTGASAPPSACTTGGLHTNEVQQHHQLQHVQVLLQQSEKQQKEDPPQLQDVQKQLHQHLDEKGHNQCNVRLE